MRQFAPHSAEGGSAQCGGWLRAVRRVARSAQCRGWLRSVQKPTCSILTVWRGLLGFHTHTIFLTTAGYGLDLYCTCTYTITVIVSLSPDSFPAIYYQPQKYACQFQMLSKCKGPIGQKSHQHYQWFKKTMPLRCQNLKCRSGH